MSRRILMIAGLVAAGAMGWYLFRPERLFLDTEVNEVFYAAGPTADAATAAAPQVVSTGRFHPVRHPGEGLATVYRLARGERVLRLTEFATDNGPDLYVYLVAAPDAEDDETVIRAGFVSLGRLKGNRGDQNYDIPADLDLATYRSVSIWCRRFGVNFVTAPLAVADSAAGG